MSLSVKALAPLSHITVDTKTIPLPEDFPLFYSARLQSEQPTTGSRHGLKEVEKASGIFFRGRFYGYLSVRLPGKEGKVVELRVEPHHGPSDEGAHSLISVVEEDPKLGKAGRE